MTWLLTRINAVTQRVKRPIDPQQLGEQLVDHYSIPALESTGGPEVVPANQIMSGKQLLEGGEVMVSRLNPRKARVVAVPHGDRVALASGEFIVMRPYGINQRFLTYYLLNDAVRQYLDSRVQSVTRSHQRVRPEALMQMALAIPELQEQRAIADYLDTQTNHIDTLITKKRRMIKLLRQRWRADIMNTIYGDRSVRQGAIRYVVDLQPGYAFPSSHFVENGIRLLRGVNITPGRLRWEADVVCVPPEDRIALSEYELAEGDLVLGMDRPFIGTGIRVASVTEVDLPCLLVQRVARIRATECSDARYILLLMESDAFVTHLTPVFTGVSVPHVSAEQILSFRAPLPSRDTQRTIATHLEQRRESLSAAADLLAAQIDLLAERRQVLVTAAVTGVMQVSEVEA